MNKYTETQTTSGTLDAQEVSLKYSYKTIPGLITIEGYAGESLADPMKACGTPETLVLLGEALVAFAKAEQERRNPTEAGTSWKN